ncbi:linear amide C-N hydrolase [Gordonia sp. (in: high G+C Gram-positive bacteria)]|uniref:linear amide C-N hydrolase n=1 Tax=Gordonia sp. (in: high G+C Gram-positive bacteria) TaxID=84139 RepID=UPI0035277C16
MCTRVLWPEAGGSVITGRNMDFHMDLRTNLWKLPRGIKRDDRVNGALTWTAKYGSVVAGVFDIVSADGMNEEGLTGHVLWLAESEYGDPDPTRPQLAMSVWMQYYLDNFATVAEAVEWTEANNPQVIPMADPTGGSHPAIHLALGDAVGDSAIFEYIDGKLNVHHSRDYWVMTNSPAYDQQLELVKQYEGLGGDAPLPGTCDARDRFARALYYVKHQPEPASKLTAIASMFSIIRNAAQPFRNPEPGKPDASQTLWQTVSDHTAKRYYFESTTRPNTVWVDLPELDFSEGSGEARLDLISDLEVEHGLSGNVTHKFKKHHKFHLVSIKQATLIGEAVEEAKKAASGAHQVQDLVREKTVAIFGAE